MRIRLEDRLLRVKVRFPLRKTLRTISSTKLLIVFAVAFSLAALPGPLTSLAGFVPTVPVAHANGAPVEPWYPAGPSMDTLVYKIYVDENAEFTGLQAGEIDLSDWPLTPSLISTLTPNVNFFVTAPISDTGYFELQFHLGSSPWGCVQDFGNSACGRDIRQAYAHALDKVKFTSLQAAIAGVSVPIDNAVPPVVDLVLPNPCGWDATHVQTGANCVVGEGGTTGGVSYHLAPAVTCGVSAPGTCSSSPTRPWTPGFGTPDFCAAADHLIAAGLAAGKVGSVAPTTVTDSCKLTGVSAAVTANLMNIFVRSDNNPRLQGGLSVAEFICALLGAGFTAGCPGSGLTVTQGPITAFPGFTTSPTTVEQDWNVYTAGFGNVLTFDSSLYFGYDSLFVSGIPSIKVSGGGHCDNNSVGTFSPPNYMYVCDQNYDTPMTQAEFAPCIGAPGDPTNGQVVPTFANCVSAPTQPTATSASYKAQDEFGKNAFTVPWFSGRNQFAYKSNWSRAALNTGSGFTPPGSFAATFNMWTATPALAGTIRQGFKEPATSANVFVSNTVWDAGLTGAIYDGPNTINPTSTQKTLDWMSISTQVLSNAQLTYAPPAGTVQTYRYTFRNDIFWQTGQKMTAWDAAFSYIAAKSTGTTLGAGLAPMVGVKVLSPTQMDVNINNFGPFTQLFLSTTVLPARFWGTCSAATWDAGASNPNFAAANSALTPCIGSATTAAGVILPNPGTSAIDSSKILPAYDPIANGIFVGTGSWVCKSGGGTIGLGCSSTGTQSVSPGGTFTFQRYGFGTTPGGSLNTYFRSSGNLALYIWTGDTGDFNHDFLNFGVVSLCFGQSLLPLGTTTGCGHWQQGIGAPTGHSTVTGIQVGIVQRFVGVNWVSPYDWVSSPPQGIVSFPPSLYDGQSNFLQPASAAPCTSAYPVGGYDC